MLVLSAHTAAARPLTWAALALSLLFVTAGQGLVSRADADAPTLATARPRLQVAFKRYVHKDGVDYRAWHADKQARSALSSFVTAAGDMPMRAPLSDWLNVYNALVVQQVLDHYPVASVMDVPDFFKAKRHRIAGARRSLDDIEHRIIRERFKDARVHMALNCGAVSCPSLSPILFQASTVEQQLTALAQAAMNDPRHVRVGDDRLAVSALFFWFAQDFEREAGSARAWIARYVGAAGAARLAKLPPDTKVDKLPYDWKLNQRP